nr:protein SCO1 homolog 2, mitochondrial [Ipomoea batatas]
MSGQSRRFHSTCYMRSGDRRNVPVEEVLLWQMAQEYRVFFRKVDGEKGKAIISLNLLTTVYLMNPNMEVVRSLGVEYDAEDLAEAIEREVKKAGNRHSG